MMSITGQTGERTGDSGLIEAGLRSSLITLGQMLPRGSLLVKSQEFIQSSTAARTCLQQLRCDGVEIALTLTGRIYGTLTLALDNRAARQLVSALAGEDATTPIFNEMARSALKEVGNIVASAFLGALEALSGRGGMPGLPDLQIGLANHDESDMAAEGSWMYALPMILVTGTDEGLAARGGIFISLQGDASNPSPPAK